MPPTYVSFDDTDSLDGMCTTYLATQVIGRCNDFDVIGFPRLVRLNPNVPWKTRGNAAIAIAFGEGRGKRFKIGEIGRQSVFAFPSGDSINAKEIFRITRGIVKENAHFDCKNTNPGLVVSNKRPSKKLYWKTVREIVSKKYVLRELDRIDALVGRFKNGRGVIGAAAAMSWVPNDRTYEVLCYRQPTRIGKIRDIDRDSVRRMDRQVRSSFHNIDPETGHLAIAPGSPCPILFGIRGDDPWDLLRAKEMIVSEPVDSWLLFLTNQASDDHIQRISIGNMRPREGVRAKGIVSSPARHIIGGHVFFEIKDGSGEITCAVYEPSGGMRSAARELMLGDIVEIFGSVRDSPFEINVEKMRIISILNEGKKIENPICPSCKKHMKSIGREAGFRCIKCGKKAPREAAKRAVRTDPKIGWYEPPIASRRHLYKPVRRIGVKRTAVREILYSYSFD